MQYITEKGMTFNLNKCIMYADIIFRQLSKSGINPDPKNQALQELPVPSQPLKGL